MQTRQSGERPRCPVSAPHTWHRYEHIPKTQIQTLGLTLHPIDILIDPLNILTWFCYSHDTLVLLTWYPLSFGLIPFYQPMIPLTISWSPWLSPYSLDLTTLSSWLSKLLPLVTLHGPLNLPSSSSGWSI